MNSSLNHDFRSRYACETQILVYDFMKTNYAGQKIDNGQAVDMVFTKFGYYESAKQQTTSKISSSRIHENERRLRTIRRSNSRLRKASYLNRFSLFSVRFVITGAQFARFVFITRINFKSSVLIISEHRLCQN